MNKKTKKLHMLLSYVLTVCLIVGLFPATTFAKSSTQVTEATKPTKKIVETTEATKPQKQKTMQVTDIETQKTEIVDIEEEPEKENLPTTQITPTTEATTINNLIENSEQNDTTQNTENCGGDHTGWIELNPSTSTLSTGNYYLTKDITSNITIPTDAEVTLCLNSHIITGSGKGSVITVNGKLTLCDCQKTGKITGGNAKNGGGVFVTGKNATFTMNGGTISRNIAYATKDSGDNNSIGGGIFVEKRATFVMNGGTISDNTATLMQESENREFGGAGAGVGISSSTFKMNGGTITSNKTPEVCGAGGGVYLCKYSTFIMDNGTIMDNMANLGSGIHVCDSTFTMNSGAIMDNEAKTDNFGKGGGVYVVNNSTFILNYGNITNNLAYYGGGICIDDDIDDEKNPTFTMNDGEISYNKATFPKNWGSSGGGVYVRYGTFNMKGGKISNNTVSAVAEGSGGGGVGVYIHGTFNMDNGEISHNIVNGTTSSNVDGVTCGAVSVYGVFNMSGGEIKDNITNTTRDGAGGVCVGTFGTFNMSVGKIKDNIINTTRNGAGGVFVGYGTFNMSGGEIKGNKTNTTCNGAGGVYVNQNSKSTFNISGNPRITENIKERDSSTKNVYLPKDKIINVIDKLETDANIGVTVEDPPTGENPSRKIAQGSGYIIPNGDKEKFKSDNTAYKTIFNSSDSAVYLGQRPDEYTVTFNYQYNERKDEKKVDAGEKVTEPAEPQREGYAFDGWFSDEACTQGYDFNTLVTEDMTLFAKWIQNKYTVTFNSNGGSTVSEQKVKHGEKVTAPTPDPQREGYTFAGWYEDENCTGNEWNFYNNIVTKNMTLYAKWTQNENPTPPNPSEEVTYTVTFNSKGGSDVSEQKVKHGEKVLQPNNPQKDGYTFVGWFTDEACTQKYDFNTTVTTSFTLYAKWDTTPPEDVDEFTVTFNTNGGSTIASQKVQSNAKVIKPTSPIKSGYTFKGWFTNTSYTQEYDFDTTVTADMTLFAKWEENKTIPSNPTLPTTKYYTVAFESNGGSAIPSQTISSGRTATMPQNPTKNDCEFLGWFADKDFNKIYRFSTPITKDITIYAKWKSDDCVVTFDSNGGSEIPSQTVAVGSKAEMPKDPTKNGYTFLGWFADEDFNEVYRFSTPVTENITIYAKWKSKSRSSSGGGGGYYRTGTWVTEEPKTAQPVVHYETVKQDCPRDETCPLWKFNDVDRWAWYHDGSHYCVEKGLIVGTTNTTFSPHMPITRAMVVTILWRIENKPLVNDVITFKDVKEDAYYAEAVRWAAHNGIVSGYSRTVFAPDDSITREQMASILYRYTQYKNRDVSGRADISNYQDKNEISNYALIAIQWACDTGVINGISTTILSPKGTTTRAQAAQMFKAYLEEQL